MKLLPKPPEIVTFTTENDEKAVQQNSNIRLQKPFSLLSLSWKKPLPTLYPSGKMIGQ